MRKPGRANPTPPLPRRRCRPGRAFSLVELLVVMAMIALLIAILLPTIRRVRAQALFVECSTRIRAQLQAHRLYGTDYRDFKPPMFIQQNGWVDAQWASPVVRWYGQSWGQGILVDRGYLPFDALLDAWDAMQEDSQNDKALFGQPFSGSSYFYFWRDPAEINWEVQRAAEGVTYHHCWRNGNKTLVMDTNMDANVPFVGVMPGGPDGWMAHPLMRKLNVGYADGSVRAFPVEQIRLKSPGYDIEQLKWFADADAHY